MFFLFQKQKQLQHNLTNFKISSYSTISQCESGSSNVGSEGMTVSSVSWFGWGWDFVSCFTWIISGLSVDNEVSWATLIAIFSSYFNSRKQACRPSQATLAAWLL